MDLNLTGACGKNVNKMNKNASKSQVKNSNISNKKIAPISSEFLLS